MVLAVATLLFIGFFLSRLQKMVSEGFLKTIYEYEENYLLLFFLRQTFLYRIYHILLTSKNFLYYFFLQFIFFFKDFSFFRSV